MSDAPTTAPPSPATDLYRAARDQLLGWRGRHEEAVRDFAFPDLGDRFNWAVDWFDEIACAETGWT